MELHDIDFSLQIRNVKDILGASNAAVYRDDKLIELVDLEPEARSDHFEKKLKALIPELQRRSKEASDRLKPWMAKQCFALPLDHERFKLITSLIARPEIKRKSQQLSALPRFLKSFVRFSEEVASLYDSIMSPNFLEELVWETMESLIKEQTKFNTEALELGTQISQLAAQLEDVYTDRKKENSTAKAFIAGGAVGAVGITAMIFGIVFAPFTAGASIPLAAAAAAMGLGAAATAGGAAAVAVGIHHHRETLSLQEALENLQQFEALAQQMIDAFNEVNEEFGPALIEKLVEQSGLICPICLHIASDDCRTVYYEEEDNDAALEIYCADCIAKWIAHHRNPVSPVTRKPITDEMLQKERSTVRRIRAFKAQMDEANGVVARFLEACQKKASLK